MMKKSPPQAGRSMLNRRSVIIGFAGSFLLLYVTLMEAFAPPQHPAELLLTEAIDAVSTESPKDTRKFRLDWLNLQPQSLLAKRIYNLQHNCSLPYSEQKWRPQGYGIGSDLHLWSSFVWAGLHGNFRIRSPDPWLWNDQQLCASLVPSKNGTEPASPSALHCYLPAAEPQCPGEIKRRARVLHGFCGKYIKWNDNISIPDFRAAATEYIFSPVSPILVTEAERQADLAFGGKPIPPRDQLITIHVRWGDKVMEMDRKNTGISLYIDAINKIVRENQLSAVHILVCTEDPKALAAFRAVANSTWNIYVEQFYNEYLPYRENRTIIYNVPSHIADETKGKAGLWALGSLLVALEANYFVLTTKSNWSRLMNELRKNVLDPRCDNCTQMIDLTYGEC